MESRPIVRSIWITSGVLFLAQVIVLAGVVAGYGIEGHIAIWYLIALPLIHALMGGVLASLHKLFINVDTGELLARVNFANLLSLIRVSSAPTILWLVLLARWYPVAPVLVPLAALVFLTDLLDGQISRRTHQITKIGRFLDSSSDYIVLFVVAVALVSYDLISTWFFVVVLARFGLQLVGQAILFVAQRMRVHFRTSFLGKASVFAVMTLFGLALLSLVDGLPDWYPRLQTVGEYVTAAIAVVSLAEKVFLFSVDARNVKKSRT
jgi:phosphatidylglycerophosphate synthase